MTHDSIPPRPNSLSIFHPACWDFDEHTHTRARTHTPLSSTTAKKISPVFTKPRNEAHRTVSRRTANANATFIGLPGRMETRGQVHEARP